MSTAIGDLVATLKVNDDPWQAGFARAETSMDHLRDRAEEGGEHVGGVSRAFGFLGKQAKEAGEEMGGGFGEAISGLGGMTSGIGEAVHGYHALHTVIGLATGAQAALNAISPVGWAAMAAGAVAAVGSYLYFHESTEKTVADLKELNSLHGPEFERASETKRAALEKEITLTEKSHTAEMIGLVGGPVGVGIGYLYEQHAIEQAHKALTAFDEATKKHRQDEASKTVNTELDKLTKQAHQLNMTPLDIFREELEKTGRSASAIADATNKFRELSDQIQASKAAEEMKKYRAEQLREVEREETQEMHRLQAEAKSLSEGPMDRLVQEAKELKEHRDWLDPRDYQSAMNALAEKARKELETKQEKAEAPKALEYGTASAFEELYKLMNPDENKPMQDVAANTAKANEPPDDRRRQSA